MRNFVNDFRYQLFTDIGAVTVAAAVVLAPLGELMRSEGGMVVPIMTMLLALPGLAIFVREMGSPPKPAPVASVFSFLAVTWGVGLPLFIACMCLFPLIPDALGVAPLPLER